MFIPDDSLFSYTRVQTLANGVLVDATDLAIVWAWDDAAPVITIMLSWRRLKEALDPAVSDDRGELSVSRSKERRTPP